MQKHRVLGFGEFRLDTDTGLAISFLLMLPLIWLISFVVPKQPLGNLIPRFVAPSLLVIGLTYLVEYAFYRMSYYLCSKQCIYTKE